MYFEDLQEEFADELAPPDWRRQLASLALLLVGVSLLVAGLLLGSALVLMGFIVLGGAMLFRYVWDWRLRAKRSPLCPQCGEALDAIRRERLFATRACPVCQFVFPSRLPPMARLVTIDRKLVPRIWLQDEVADGEPAEQGSEVNPYQAPRATTVSSPQKVGCLWMWVEGMLGPFRALMQSDDELLSDPRLPAQREPLTPRARRMRETFVRSRRRHAWFMLPFTVAAPILLTLGAVLASLPYCHEALHYVSLALAVVVLQLATVTAGMMLTGVIAARGPRGLKDWLQGGRDPVEAEHEPRTQYYGIRIRLINITTQPELPHLKFLLRQAEPGEAQLRVVNFTLATALEMPLALPKGGEWQAVDIDLRTMVRQSAPDFFGDELHLAGDPAKGPLELSRYEVVPRW